MTHTIHRELDWGITPDLYPDVIIIIIIIKDM